MQLEYENMANEILTRYVASITDLKKSPVETVQQAHGEALAILNRNKPAFYCVPSDLYEQMLDLLEDQYLNMIADERESKPSVRISTDELRSRIRRKST